MIVTFAGFGPMHEAARMDVLERARQLPKNRPDLRLGQRPARAAGGRDRPPRTAPSQEYVWYAGNRRFRRAMFSWCSLLKKIGFLMEAGKGRGRRSAVAHHLERHLFAGDSSCAR